MALFKSEEEKRLFEEKRKKEQREFEEEILRQRQERIKKNENEILKEGVFKGKVGSTHTGWSFRDGFRNADKTKFKKTKFQIFDDKLVIERNRNVVHFSNVKEIFYGGKSEALIILNNGDAIPIKNGNWELLEAFINVLNKLTENAKSNANVTQSNINKGTSEDKIDKLLKLGEMHDKGLLSDEEFTSLKQELLGNNEDTTPAEDDDQPSEENVCENCGAEVAEDSVFCAECGTKIK